MDMSKNEILAFAEILKAFPDAWKGAGAEIHIPKIKGMTGRRVCTIVRSALRKHGAPLAIVFYGGYMFDVENKRLPSQHLRALDLEDNAGFYAGD